MKKFYLLIVLLLGMLNTHSQAVNLDPSFAGKGWTFADFEKGNLYNEYSRKVLQQQDGAFIVVNEVKGYTVLSRYFSNGVPDNSFGTNGYNGYLAITPRKAALQSDGKIVVAGSVSSSNSGTNLAVARYNTDGSLDRSFDGDGLVSTDYSSNNEEGYALALQSDGKIVVLGYTYNYNAYNPDLIVVRYHPDGSLDHSFDGDGLQVSDFNGAEFAADLAIQGDGKIVVAGYAYDYIDYNRDFVVVRYNADGSLDHSFANQGLQAVDFFGDNDIASSLALQGDGKIVLAGQVLHPETFDYDFGLARYNTDGTLDHSFGSDGKVVTDMGRNLDMVTSLAVQSDGRMVVAGYTYKWFNDPNHDFALARFNQDGTLDDSFDGDGKLVTDLPATRDDIYSLFNQANGKIVVAGSTADLHSNNDDMVLARYNTDGSLDHSFNGNGWVTSYYPEESSSFYALAVQSDGKLLAAGRAINPYAPNHDFALTRLNRDGSLDEAFGKGGRVTTEMGGNDAVNAIVVQSDGKIVAAGNTYYPDNGRYNFTVARYHTDGSLDLAFGQEGKVTTDFGGDDFASAAALQSDGKIVVAGYTYVYNGNTQPIDTAFALVRYNPDGTPDNSFDGDGMLITSLPQGYCNGYAVAIQEDRIMVAGRSSALATPGSDITLVRYHPDGSPDLSFGSGGVVATDVLGVNDAARALVLQSDGKIVAAGYSFNLNVSRNNIVLVRYHPYGTLDSSFGGSGKVSTDVAGKYVYAYAAALQGNGKVVTAGYAYDVKTYRVDFALARYHTDGSLDTTFGDRGVLIADLSDVQDYPYALAIDKNRLYVAGSSSGIAQQGIIAAYRLDCGDREVCGNRVDDNCDGQVDEGCAATPFLTINDVTVSEDLQRATLMVTLSKKADVPVSFSYFTQDRTAVSKANKGARDFEAESGTLTIPAGQQTAVISIDIIDDNLTEGEEFFEVHLQHPVHAALSGDKGRVTIQDGQPSVGIGLTSSVPEKEEKQGVNRLTAKAQPNPSAGAFTLVLQSPKNAPVTIKITDAAGRLVEAKAGIPANTTLQIGLHYRPGVYYAEVVQGSERVSLKLVKQ